MSATIAKPQLRGFLAKRIKFHLIGATLFSCTGGLLFKIYYVDRRKRLNREFPKIYDMDRHEQVMIEHGLLQSMPNFKTWEE